MWIKTQYVCRLIAYGAPVSEVHVRLRAFMQAYEPISAADWALISPRWAPFRAKPATPILREGEVCRHVYFLNGGLARYHYADEEGVDRTKFFIEPPYVFTAQRSFNAGEPSREAITAVTACTDLRISRDDVSTLLGEVPAFATFVRKLVAEVQRPNGAGAPLASHRGHPRGDADDDGRGALRANARGAPDAAARSAAQVLGQLPRGSSTEPKPYSPPRGRRLGVGK